MSHSIATKHCCCFSSLVHGYTCGEAAFQLQFSCIDSRRRSWHSLTPVYVCEGRRRRRKSFSLPLHVNLLEIFYHPLSPDGKSANIWLFRPDLKRSTAEEPVRWTLNKLALGFWKFQATLKWNIFTKFLTLRVFPPLLTGSWCLQRVEAGALQDVLFAVRSCGREEDPRSGSCVFQASGHRCMDTSQSHDTVPPGQIGPTALRNGLVSTWLTFSDGFWMHLLFNAIYFSFVVWLSRCVIS